jgi:hypothetical protein
MKHPRRRKWKRNNDKGWKKLKKKLKGRVKRA